jgi:hypothetical protein
MSASCRLRLLQTTIMLLVVGVIPSEARVAPALAPGVGQTPPVQATKPTSVIASKRRIFVCHGIAVREFADRPCGSLTVERELRVLTPPTPAGTRFVSADLPDGSDDTATRTAAGRPQVTVPTGSAGPLPGQREQCNELQIQVADIDQRMRAGYSAREAARLWQRWHDAKDRLHRAGC